MSHDPLSRRLFLSSSLSALSSLSVVSAAPLLLGCTSPSSSPAAAAPPPRRCVRGVGTAANIEGPYYRAGAPFRADLVDADVVGAPLRVSGAVLSLDCKTPLAGAVLDVWQANGNGQYDNDGTLRLPASQRGAMRLRGKVRADARGDFSFATVLPGHYLNGRVYRPAHIHVKVSAPGHAPLTTQLYFPDDPYNAADPFIERSLIMDVARTSGAFAARYDFVLRPA